jgi:cytochrome c oxidase subunit 3
MLLFDGFIVSTTLTPTEIKEPRVATGGGGFDDKFNGGDGDGGGDGSRPPERTPPPEGYRIAIWLVLISVTMMFAALTSAYVVLQAQGVPIAAPRVLWFSTAVILACSFTLETARRALRQRNEPAFARGIYLTMALGVVFLLSQFSALRTLRASGFFITTNKHSWFAYLFTGLHGVHLFGGLLALGFVIWRHRRGYWTVVRKRAAVDATAIYWHFIDGLWLFLFVLLFFWGSA